MTNEERAREVWIEIDEHGYERNVARATIARAIDEVGAAEFARGREEGMRERRETCHACHDAGGDSETGPCPECGGDGGSREYRIALRVARSACPCYGDGETGPTKCGESVAYPTCELHSKIADAFVDFIADPDSARTAPKGPANG